MVKKHQMRARRHSHGADRVARLKMLAWSKPQHRGAASYLRMWKARAVPIPMINTTERPQQDVAV